MRERVIDICYFDTDLQKSIPKRNYKPIVLINQSSYHVIKKQINAMIGNKDTINGLDILVSNQCKYQDYISTIDFFLKGHYDYWYVYGNHIKVVFSKNESESQEQILLNNYFNDSVIPVIEHHDINPLYFRLKNLLKGKIHDIRIMDWHFLIIYISLIVFALWHFYNLTTTQKP